MENLKQPASNGMKILIVVPAYNEEKILEKNILILFDFCQNNISDNWTIVIADNDSTDATAKIGQQLSNTHANIEYFDAGSRGKGLAVKTAWEKNSADVYVFMDADLATDLSSLPGLIAGIIKENFDIIVGSRFHKGSNVQRSLTRKFFSAGYRGILKILLRLKISDAPCGFKAINQRVKENILPRVKDNKWFFDSELIIIAENMQYKIKEIPVIWSDPRQGRDKSKVNPISLAKAYMKKVLEIKHRLKNFHDK